MRQQIDKLVATEQQIQVFLVLVNQKASAMPCAYKQVVVRGFDFDLDFAHALALVGGRLELARAFNRNLTSNLERQLALDLVDFDVSSLPFLSAFQGFSSVSPFEDSILR